MLGMGDHVESGMSKTRTSIALALLLGACSGSGPSSSTTPGPVVGPPAGVHSVPPSIRVVFRGGKVFAREGGREWPIAEVSRDEMLWAPDGMRFAYLKEKPRKETPPASQPADPEPPGVKRTKKKRKKKTKDSDSDNAPIFHIVIRNIRGDSVNEFPVYRPGRPTRLDWINNDSIGYQAPPDESGDVYVIHSTTTSEILEIYRGARFIWSPGRRHLAYVANPDRDQLVKVNHTVVWPRQGVDGRRRVRTRHTRARRNKGPKRHVKGELVWSPDGAGLAFMVVDGGSARLVVLLVVDNEQGDLTWPLPETALTPGNRLFWGESKVVIGESMLKPRFAASWKRLR
jgi:hypothetical protein